MGTDLHYNGVTLRNVLTRAFSQEAVYDEISGTDLVFHKYTIQVTAYVHGRTNVFTTGTIPTVSGSAVATEVLIRQRLLAPRGDFRFTVAGEPLLFANRADDRNNGPKPRRCVVAKIAGSQLLRIDYEIEVCVVDCDSDRNHYGVLSNRWGFEDSIDTDWYTRRTIRGRLRVARLDLNPQAFRGWVVPPLQDGFRRESMDFVTTPDGLTLEYTIVDQQTYAAAPYPATSWKCTHTESTNDGVKSAGELSVELRGPSGVDKRALIQLAAILVEGVLRIGRSPHDEANVLIEQAAIIDHMHDSAIEMRVRVLQTYNDPETYFSIHGNRLGKPPDDSLIPGYDRFKSPVPTQVDLASPTGLFISYLQNPCNTTHRVDEGQRTTQAAIESKRDATTITTSTGTPYPTSPRQEYTQRHRQFMYTYYTVDSEYRIDGNRLQLPIAGSPSTSGRSNRRPTGRVVRLADPTAQRIITIEAERAGTWPELSMIEDLTSDPTGTARLLSAVVENRNSKLSADGVTRIYYLRQVLIYALDRPPRPGEFIAGTPPYQLVGDSRNVFLPAEVFADYII